MKDVLKRKDLDKRPLLFPMFLKATQLLRYRRHSSASQLEMTAIKSPFLKGANTLVLQE